MMGETLLPKKLALPVFCSDPLSSNAYATEEILLMLSLGGLTLLHLTAWVGAAVVLLLVVVVLSYRQTCHAYPDGGGAYAVSRANLGHKAALIAASALLVDYVLTVAVSVAAGVANIVSAVPSLAPHVVILAVGLVSLLAMMNLRGLKESGRFFAIPTYGFVLCVFAMIALGLMQMLWGHAPVAESSTIGIRAQENASGLLLVALVLRAFASGCTALTGVEAVSNGVPNFKKPRSHHAAATLAIMGTLTIVMFVGITTLALVAKVHVGADPSQLVGAPSGYHQGTVIAQIAGAVFGSNSFGFFAVQAFTAAILVMAANTAFNGFPILASILGQHGYLPRQFARRGDRLVFSNGIVILALMAIALIWAFDASTTRLIQLYIIGVFVSFTLSQSGMVRHWLTLIARTFDPSKAQPDPACARDQHHRCGHHGTRSGDRAHHQVHARGLDRGHRDAACLRADDRDPAPLRPGQHRAATPTGRRDAAEPHPRDRAGLEAACTDAAGAGLRPGDAAADADRTHR